MKKRLISSLLAATFMITSVTIPSFADDDLFEISLANPKTGSDGKYEVYPGGVVEIPVTLTSNPGFVSLSYRINYNPNELELTGVTDTGIIVGSKDGAEYAADYTASENLNVIPYRQNFEIATSDVNFAKTGVISILEFKLKDGIEVGKEVEVGFIIRPEDKVVDHDVNKEVELETLTPAVIKVVDVPTHSVGDIDFKITSKDAQLTIKGDENDDKNTIIELGENTASANVNITFEGSLDEDPEVAGKGLEITVDGDVKPTDPDPTEPDPTEPDPVWGAYDYTDAEIANSEYVKVDGKYIGLYSNALAGTPTAELVFDETALKFKVISGTYKTLYIQTGTEVNGTAHYGTQFAPEAGKKYKVIFTGSIDTDVTDAQIRFKSNLNIGNETQTQYRAISKTPTEISFTYTQGTGASEGGNIAIDTGTIAAGTVITIDNLRIIEETEVNSLSIDESGSGAAASVTSLDIAIDAKVLAEQENGAVVTLMIGGEAYTFTFISTYKPPVIEEPVKYGDANGDGIIDGDDAVLIMQYAAGGYDTSAINEENADANDDGVIDGDDAVLVKQEAAGGYDVVFGPRS